MEIIVISIAAFGASLLTFFSGFGLGTILTPVFAIFFPIEVSIALTGIVHLLNNFFKISLVGKQINWSIGIKFGAMSVIGAFLGAYILLQLSNEIIIYSYEISGKHFSITLIKFLIALLMIVFSLFEIVPKLKKIQFDEKKLIAGGLISGFFGGLSGNQGALRSMFLIRCGLEAKSFIATGIFIACVVDITRLSVYFSRLSSLNIQNNLTILLTAISFAFLGAYIGSKLLKKVTLKFIQCTVSILIILIASALALGLI